MHIPCLWVYTSQPFTTKCRIGKDSNKCGDGLQWIRRAEDIAFLVGGKLLEVVGILKYPERGMYRPDNNCPALYTRPIKERKCWGHFGRILGR